MTEPTITAEQVMAEGVIHQPAAQRLATYANQRAAGDRPGEAARAVGISGSNVGRYERWLTRWRREHGLPPLPASSIDRDGNGSRTVWRNGGAWRT